jgi:hypothetical protein
MVASLLAMTTPTPASDFPVLRRFGVARHCATAVMGVALVCGSGLQAQQTPDVSTTPQVHAKSDAGAHHKKALPPQTEAPSANPAPAPAPTIPANPSDSAAVPARVTLSGGKLTVDANNSDLQSILQDVARSSGMTIDGLSQGKRVFGVYGPGTPRDVLTDLLAGSGYNFMMLGGANGSVPSQLVLTAQGSAPPSKPTSSATSANADSDADDQEPLGPGAIAHPRPQESDDIDNQTRAQQHLQNLQDMHDRLQQQQQQQQNNPQ